MTCGARGQRGGKTGYGPSLVQAWCKPVQPIRTPNHPPRDLIDEMWRLASGAIYTPIRLVPSINGSATSATSLCQTHASLPCRGHGQTAADLPPSHFVMLDKAGVWEGPKSGDFGGLWKGQQR